MIKKIELLGKIERLDIRIHNLEDSKKENEKFTECLLAFLGIDYTTEKIVKEIYTTLPFHRRVWNGDEIVKVYKFKKIKKNSLQKIIK